MSTLGMIGGAAMGGLLNEWSNNQQKEYSKEMANFNQGKQMEMAQFYNKMSMDKWNKTNVGAQMKHMKDAGLNIGMIYGGGGAGGKTTDSVTAGTAQGGAPNGNMMGIGLQQGAQMSLMKTQERKLNAEAETTELENQILKESGMNKQTAQNMNDIEEAKAKGKILYNQWQTRDGGYEWWNKPEAETRGEQIVLNNSIVSDVEARIQKETEENKKKQVAQQLANAVMEERLKEANINLNRQKERQLYHAIIQDYIKAGFKGIDSIIGMKLGTVGKQLKTK